MITSLQTLFPHGKNAVFTLVRSMLVILLFCCTQAVKAQQIIFTVNGIGIPCKVQDVGEDSVAYNETADLAGKPKLIARKDISIIRTIQNNYEEPFNTDAILTTVNRPIYAKPITSDEAAGIITYTLYGTTEVQKIPIKSVQYIKYANNTKKLFNIPGQKPQPGVIKPAPKIDEDTAQKNNSMLTILQNWKSKYLAPPLDVL